MDCAPLSPMMDCVYPTVMGYMESYFNAGDELSAAHHQTSNPRGPLASFTRKVPRFFDTLTSAVLILFYLVSFVAK